MRNLKAYVIVVCLILGSYLGGSPCVHAHLMVAQHGTLNIVDDGVFMVLSLPVSAFGDLDQNGDGDVSMLEFNTHRAQVVELVEQNISLRDDHRSLALEGLLLSPVLSHDSNAQAIDQVTVLGRFNLNVSATDLAFTVGIYGRERSEQTLEITVTDSAMDLKNVFVLSPEVSTSTLFIQKV